MSDLQLEFIEARRQRGTPALEEARSKHRHEPRKSVAGTSARPMRSPDLRPLVVDLDGTLVRSDLLIETAFIELSQRPHSIWEMFQALCKGKASLKHRLSEPAEFDPAMLPYDDEVLRVLRAAAAEGRPLYLASASHENLVGRVADHLGIFDGSFATNASSNCAGQIKAERLVAAFGEGGFDYIGNDSADLPVWRHAAKAYAVRTSPGVTRRLTSECSDVEYLPHDRPSLGTWTRLLRVHQYAKNGLVAIPLVTNQMFDWSSLLQVVLAAVAFSLCASSVYLLNDLVDLQDDRLHRTKCRRPLACGDIPLSYALILIPLLFGLSIVVAGAISPAFLGVLCAYVLLTTAYSFYLKRKMILDVVTLSSLYTLRVVGGAAALSTMVSPWLLAFVMTWFLSLALVKRYVELVARQTDNLQDSRSRDYKNSDAGMVGALAAAAGLNAITLLFLYLSTDDVQELYQRPEVLWLAGPLMTYWILRALMLAHRGSMHDDPVVFALKDKASLATLGLVGAAVVGAL